MINEEENIIEIPFIHRDLSWLSFNYRVLQEAKDVTAPLLERLKFLAIYSSNLDEFFRVRVAHHRNLMRAGKKTKKQLEFSPKLLIKKITKEVNRQQDEFSRIFLEEIIPELKDQGIRLRRRLELDPDQKVFVEDYFKDRLLPFVQPVLLVNGMILPFLNNAELYLGLELKNKKKTNPKSEFAIVKVPSDYLPRFVELPSPEGVHDLIILDDIVRHSVSMLFPGYDIEDTYSLKLTRDADLYIDDEFSGDLVEKIKSGLGKRNVGPAARFVFDRNMPGEMLEYMMNTFEIEPTDLLREGRYHNNFDFFGFPDYGKTHLKNKPLPPLPYEALERSSDFYQSIQEKDHLLQVPYQSYDAVVRFFEEAAKDTKVTHIKIVQYRVARKSRIMNALLRAVESGKQVTVFVEVKARFDEEANLRWAAKLEKGGVNVLYSFPGLKVHSKLALVRREEDDAQRLYAYLGTGNFHEGTAKIYGDYGLFTADERLTGEVARVFNFLETVKMPHTPFEHLLVGQFNLRPALIEKIEREIRHARAGRPARMVLKMNSLEDREMVEKLYEASNVGVKIDLIIRGICCLVPGVQGFSENIRAISIVDRFLEHARVFWFNNNGEDEMYLSSADFMRRNLSYRIETSFPIYDQEIKTEIKQVLELQLSDNTKARVLDKKMSNEYSKEGEDMPIRSQVETYYRIKRKYEQF